MEYKRTIVREADACKTAGAPLGPCCGLYSSHLATRRAARERGELAEPARRWDPAPRPSDPRDKRITELERETIRWRKRTEALVELATKEALLH